jgi:hypothetical protein
MATGEGRQQRRARRDQKQRLGREKDKAREIKQRREQQQQHQRGGMLGSFGVGFDPGEQGPVGAEVETRLHGGGDETAGG